MEYFLAHIVSSTTGDSYYELVKADSRKEAYRKVRRIVDSNDDVEISSAIE